MTAIFVYVTTADDDEALKIARQAVTDRLAACANILPGMTSVCHWDGEIKQSDETVLVLKTRASLYPALETAIRQMHSYKNPCIVALPVMAGSADFLNWMMAETKP